MWCSDHVFSIWNFFCVNISQQWNIISCHLIHSIAYVSRDFVGTFREIVQIHGRNPKRSNDRTENALNVTLEVLRTADIWWTFKIVIHPSDPNEVITRSRWMMWWWLCILSTSTHSNRIAEKWKKMNQLKLFEFECTAIVIVIMNRRSNRLAHNRIERQSKWVSCKTNRSIEWLQHQISKWCLLFASNHLPSTELIELFDSGIFVPLHSVFSAICWLFRIRKKSLYESQ